MGVRRFGGLTLSRMATFTMGVVVSSIIFPYDGKEMDWVMPTGRSVMGSSCHASCTL